MVSLRKRARDFSGKEAPTVQTAPSVAPVAEPPAGKCARDGLSWDHADFVPTVERHLGLRQKAPSNGNGHEPPMPAPPAHRNPPPTTANNALWRSARERPADKRCAVLVQRQANEFACTADAG